MSEGFYIFNFSPAQIRHSSPVEGVRHETTSLNHHRNGGEAHEEVYFDSGGNDTELIAVLNATSHVSRQEWQRNMTILAQQRQSEKGERHYEQNERYGYNHRRAAQWQPLLLTKQPAG